MLRKKEITDMKFIEMASDVVCEEYPGIPRPLEDFLTNYTARLAARIFECDYTPVYTSECEEKLPTIETMQAGPWKIIISERADNKSQLVMMWRDHVRVDRILDSKHKALEYAFNVLVN